MARNRFLGTTADVAILVNNSTLIVTANPTATFTFWSAATGGSQYFDLKELDGTTTVVAYHPNADGSMRTIYGPDSVVQMWADGGGSERFLVQCWTIDSAGNASVMTPTALKSVSYTGVGLDFIPWDLTSANGTLTLPTGVPDHTQIGIQIQAVSTGVVGAFTLTINRGGTDHFKSTTGPTSLTMNELEQTIVLQYQSSSGVWLIVGSYRSLASTSTVNAAAFAPLGAADKYMAFGISNAITNGLIVLTQELWHAASTTYTDMLTSLEYPNLASGSVVFTITDWNPGTNTQTVIGTQTILAAGGTATATSNCRAGRLVFNSGTSYTVASGHFLRQYVTATNGAGNWGSGPELHLLQSGTFTLPTAPTAPGSAPTTSTGASSVTLTQALTTGAAEMLHIDTGASPPAVVGRTQAGSFQVTGLLPGAATTYATLALAPWCSSTISPNTSSVGPSTSFTSFGTDGTWDASALWVPTLGTNSGVAASVTSGIGTFVSGAVGNNAAQDKIWSTFNGETGTGANIHSAWRAEDIKVALGSSSDFWEVYFSCDAFVSLSTTMTHFLQFQLNSVGIRVGYKAGGSFTKLSETGNANLTFLGTSTDASGQIHYSATQTTDGAHYYGVGFEALLIDGSGNQTINVYSGTEAQADLGFGGSGMPLIATILVPAAVRSLIPAGYCAFQKLGTQSATAVAQTTRFKGPNTMKITPLSPKNA